MKLRTRAKVTRNPESAKMGVLVLLAAMPPTILGAVFLKRLG